MTTWPHVTLTRGQVWHYFFRSTSTHFDTSRREERDGVRIIFLAFLFQKVICEKLFLSKTSVLTVLEIWSLTHLRWVNSDNIRAKEQLKSYRMHFSVASYLPICNSFWLSEIMAHFRRNMVFRLIWTSITSENLNIDRSENLTEEVSKWSLTSFRTIFFCFVLRHLGAELDRGGGV